MVVKFPYRFSLAVTRVGIEPISGGGGHPPVGTPTRGVGLVVLHVVEVVIFLRTTRYSSVNFPPIEYGEANVL